MKMAALMEFNASFHMVFTLFSNWFALGWKESEYHPLFYKTKPCTAFS